ncbi:glycosyltransferase family 2 protein [Pulveribacter sp.]|uniref:glycosyltransferase family 2 protein n=1 Tax=Pulveribacter sp. TaxID=2678893 RepID=UPI0028AFF1CA|nr:glycosyltransferase family 2 protein [Pulveribacter sp.]
MSVTSRLRHLPRKLRLLVRSLRHLARDRAHLRHNLRELRTAWKDGGLPALKYALVRLGEGPLTPADTWQQHRAAFAASCGPAIREAIAAMQAPPRIAILVPTWNTPEPMLLAMLQSVREQWYPHWELCIADDASSQPHVRRILQDWARRDSRIRLHLGDTNRGVSHATNQALALCTCPFTVLLDHDDLLEPQALFRVAESVLQDDPDLLYSDEVLISADGASVLQYVCRPSFSPEYLRQHPYIVHLVGFRTQLLRELGGLDETLAISQDYDLILRASERARTIVHLPEFLYQWRTHATSAGHDKAGQVMQASIQVLRRHLQRIGLQGSVEPGLSFNFYLPRYTPQPGQRVAIIIPTKNHGALVRQCIDSLHATIGTALACDIILIDHDSSDPESLAYFDTLAPEVTVLRYSGPFNFSAINNWAVRQLPPGRHTHYLFCNNDIEAIEPGWLEHMLALAQQPDVGMVGAQLLYPDRTTIQHAGVCVGAFGIAEHYGKFLRLPPDRVDIAHQGRLVATHEVAAVTAACLLMRSDAFEAIGGYDETLAVGFGDVDLCLRTLEQGWRILYCPHATLLHHESLTRGKAEGYDPHPEDSAAFLARWQAWINVGDPYFHPAYEPRHTCWLLRTPLPCTTQLHRRLWRAGRLGHAATQPAA